MATTAEAFGATEEDIAAPMHGRNKPIALGQVGIRCMHCKRKYNFRRFFLNVLHKSSSFQFWFAKSFRRLQNWDSLIYSKSFRREPRRTRAAGH